MNPPCRDHTESRDDVFFQRDLRLLHQCLAALVEHIPRDTLLGHIHTLKLHQMPDFLDGQSLPVKGHPPFLSCTLL